LTADENENLIRLGLELGKAEPYPVPNSQKYRKLLQDEIRHIIERVED